MTSYAGNYLRKYGQSSDVTAEDAGLPASAAAKTIAENDTAFSNTLFVIHLIQLAPRNERKAGAGFVE